MNDRVREKKASDNRQRRKKGKKMQERKADGEVHTYMHRSAKGKEETKKKGDYSLSSESESLTSSESSLNLIMIAPGGLAVLVGVFVGPVFIQMVRVYVEWLKNVYGMWSSGVVGDMFQVEALEPFGVLRKL